MCKPLFTSISIEFNRIHLILMQIRLIVSFVSRPTPDHFSQTQTHSKCLAKTNRSSTRCFRTCTDTTTWRSTRSPPTQTSSSACSRRSVCIRSSTTNSTIYSTTMIWIRRVCIESISSGGHNNGDSNIQDLEHHFPFKHSISN